MKGEVVYLYAFDVADEIATRQVSDILANKAFPYEIRTDHTFPKDVPLYKPLAIELPPLEPTLRGSLVRQAVRVYDVGVVSIVFRASFSCERLADLLPLHRATLDNGQTLDALARQLCGEVRLSLADVMSEPSAPSEPEAYTAFCLTELDGVQEVPPWAQAHRREVAELLTEAQTGTLSEQQVNEVLRVERSYTTGDWTVIDWDAALVVDTHGYVEDVLYMLELANLQLEEYRQMDERLDRYLDRTYDVLRRNRRRLLGTYGATLRTLRLFQVDVTRLNDEVSHITKLVGDWYLARVYLGAFERFHLDVWRHSVDDRLRQLDQLYTVVNSDINNRRMVVLEVLIVILFTIDLVIIGLK